MIRQRLDVSTRVADPAMILAAHDRLEGLAIDRIKGGIFRPADHLITHANRITFAPAGLVAQIS
ncbi:hypothetical protein [Tateyamaria sp.]|uniref:hypothetical protein n=1 Tax=Tateyamaria sp. TaxID=1929288 RepID=UPI003B21C34F